MRYIMDTDHLSLAQRRHPQVVAQLLAVSPDQRAITIITVDEQLKGRLAQVRNAPDPATLTHAYRHLQETLLSLTALHIMPFDMAAGEQFAALRGQGIRIGTQDLRIAAICLVHAATIVTRNARDFRQVPNLRIIDWTTTRR